MGPDPTWAYFWPAVNKRPTHLWPGNFLTRPKANFQGKKLENFVFLGEIFQTQTIDGGWPDPTWGQNILTRTHHYKKFKVLLT